MHLIFQDAVLRGLQAPERGQADYADKLTPGLTLRVGKRTKTFMFLRSVDGRRERITIGQFPAVSLAKAREEARKLAAEKILGLAAPRASTAFADCLAEFLAGCRKRNRPSTADETERLLRRHFTFTGDVADITTGELVRAIDKIRAPSEARHAYVAARTFFNWLAKRRLVAHSPLIGVDAPRKGESRERVLSDSELVSIWRHAPTNAYGAIVRLGIITGQRMGQLGGLKGAFIDLGEAVLSWPAQAMKGNRRHAIPLTAMAADILRPYLREGLLFPTRDGAAFAAWARNKDRLDDASGVKGWVHHDLRRTWATKAVEWNRTPPHVIERVLAHASGTISGVAAIYNRATYMPEMREALEKWEAKLQSLLSEP